ncbi:OVARIAN TUMOR DOMAIN-containing deubiquitinating enzyme 4 [Linum grandiflorum]
MIVCSSVSSCTKHVVCLRGRVRHMGSNILDVVSKGQPSSCSLYSTGCVNHSYTRLSTSKKFSSPSTIHFCSVRNSCYGSCSSGKRSSLQSLTVKNSLAAGSSIKRYLNISFPSQNMSMGLSLSKNGVTSKIRGNLGTISWSQGCTSGLIFGILVCCSSSDQAYSEVPVNKKDEDPESDFPYVKNSNGRKIYTDYTITGIPGDGRCLFRSVAHGACVRAGKSPPSESIQRELADDLRNRIADEFIKRREETEWFVEGDFDTYVAQIRKAHVWGGEPELFMASHVLKTPISVYMYDEKAGGLISIAEYGEEYGKSNPIRVLYHGCGHYDALQIPGRKAGQSKL